METEANPNVALKPPPLNSDQLNYLIWRYLQEAGYGDAAVKLQRDWKSEPENLPFAKHIKGQALVQLVQKGLRYHHLSLTIDESGRPLTSVNPSTFFFGPEGARPTGSSLSKEPLYRLNEAQRPSSPFNGSSSVPKKRETDSNGSLDPTQASAKRSRKTTQSANTDRNGNGVRKTSASASDAQPVGMDIDHINGNMRSPSIGDNQHDEHAVNGMNIDSRMDLDMDPASPGPGGLDPLLQDSSEPLIPLVHTLTNGSSRGIQVAPAKVANLGPSTTIVSLPEKSHVTKSLWRPTDSSLLTVTGDHFCGAWKTSGPSSSSQEDGTKMVYQDLLEPNEAVLVTAVAWEPNGGLLALATYSDQTGQLYLFDGRELILTENLPASQRAVTSLKWLPSSLRLIGIAPCDDQAPDQGISSTVLLWDFSDGQFSQSPSTLIVPEILLGVDSARYAGQEVVCVAGGRTVFYCHAGSELAVVDHWSSPPGEGVNWEFVRCAGRASSGATMIVASAESPRIWLPTQKCMQHNAHDSTITGLELRPRAFHNGDLLTVPDFATSSMDGTIKVWRFDPQSNSIGTIQQLRISQASPIMSLTFSPDGFCLAGASYGNAQIWNAEHGYHLMASWEGNGDEWRGIALRDEDTMSAGGISSINGDSGPLSADHSLAWDADSKKLAFSLGSQVAIINFQR